MEWNDEAITRLRGLWAEGHSTAEIGRRMGISKNAIVGKVHRLALPGRPSPIRRDGGGRAARRPSVRRVTGPTLPPLPATAPVQTLPQFAARPLQPPPQSAPAAERPPLRQVPAPSYIPRTTACCWPIGEPGTKTFRFCDADSTPGKPYCAEHAQIAYVKVRDRREEAA